MQELAALQAQLDAAKKAADEEKACLAEQRAAMLQDIEKVI